MFTQIPLNDYIKKMADTTFPSPKGGSALAINSAMGAALVKMCCQVSQKRKPHLASYGDFATQADLLMKQFIQLADEDTKMVKKMITALRLPKDTEENIEIIHTAIAGATKTLIQINQKTADLIQLGEEVGPLCIASCQGDLNIVLTMGLAVDKATTQLIKENYRFMESLGAEK